jgi:hypothetical protein
MAARKKRTPPKRLFRQRRIPADVMRVIDGLAQDSPELRAALYEAVAMFADEVFWEALVSAPLHQRAAILLSLRDAACALRDSKPCDFCEARALRIRFTAIASTEDFRGVKRPDEAGALVGFAVTCDRWLRDGRV